jgi:GT2 family glycosyltransferase
LTSGELTNVSVIICTYADRRWAELQAAVRSASDQTGDPSQVIVVVDHNDSLEARARREMPGVRVISNQHHRGLSGARNSGIEASTGEIIVFLDDDAVAGEGWLTRLIAPFSSAEVVGVGGFVEPMWPAGRPGWFPDEFDWVVGCSYRGMPTSTRQVRNPIGCNMSFRREVFAEIGGFRTDLGRIGRRPVGAEETELCIRLAVQMPSKRVVYVPEAAVRHRIPASRATVHYFLERCYYEGVSKGTLGRIAGTAGTFRTESEYVRSTLPSDVARALGHAIRRRDPMGVGRAAAICLGLTFTVVGFVIGIAVRPSSTTE